MVYLYQRGRHKLKLQKKKNLSSCLLLSGFFDMDYGNIKIFSVFYLLISVSSRSWTSWGAWWWQVRHHQEGRSTTGMGFTMSWTWHSEGMRGERWAGLAQSVISNLTENCMADTEGRGCPTRQEQEQLCSFQRAPQAGQSSAFKLPCFFRAAANAPWRIKCWLCLSWVQPTAQLSCSPAGVEEEDQSLLQPKQSALEEEEPYLSHYYLWARTEEQTQTSPYLQWTKTNRMLHFALRCHK